MANKVILLGRLGKDPEMKTTKSGKSVCTFSLATSFKAGGEERTTWHNIVAWERNAEVLTQYLSKGRQVLIEGRIDNRSYEDGDGNKKYISEVIVERFDFVGDRDSNESPKAKASTAPSDDDALPF